MRYNQIKQRATPTWASKEKINNFYKAARKIRYEVDHIVPLRHRYVCGLHCEDNLQLLAPHINNFKSNHTWPNSPNEILELPFSLQLQLHL